MNIKRSLLVVLLASTGVPAAAQDVPATQLQDHAEVVRQDMLTRSLLRQPRRRTPTPTLNARAAATCANKGSAAARLGMDDPRVKRLYALCAQAGR